MPHAVGIYEKHLMRTGLEQVDECESNAKTEGPKRTQAARQKQGDGCKLTQGTPNHKHQGREVQGQKHRRTGGDALRYAQVAHMRKKQRMKPAGVVCFSEPVSAVFGIEIRMQKESRRT